MSDPLDLNAAKRWAENIAWSGDREIADALIAEVKRLRQREETAAKLLTSALNQFAIMRPPMTWSDPAEQWLAGRVEVLEANGDTQ